MAPRGLRRGKEVLRSGNFWASDGGAHSAAYCSIAASRTAQSRLKIMVSAVQFCPSPPASLLHNELFWRAPSAVFAGQLAEIGHSVGTAADLQPTSSLR